MVAAKSVGSAPLSADCARTVLASAAIRASHKEPLIVGAGALQTRGRPPGVCSRTCNGEVVGLEATLEFEGEQQVRELALPICTPFAISVFAGEVVDVDPADHSMSA